MYWSVIAIVVIFIGLLLLQLLLKRIEEKRPWPFRKKEVMSKPEQILFFRLQEAFPHKLTLAQVGMSRALWSPTSWKWFNRIKSKSFDFVICNKDSSILFVAELDDSSHKGREKADATKEKALKDAGIPLIRWNVKNMPDVALIRETVRKRLTEHQNPS